MNLKATSRLRVHPRRMGSLRTWVFSLTAAGTMAMGGCGDSGPAMYELSGTVTYKGEPLPVGHIRFEPQQGVRTKETVTQSLILKGEYEVEVTGGRHRVMIRDMAGDYEHPDVPDARTLFIKEYRTQIELPTVEDVEGAQVQDFEIPASHR